ncbi:MAG: hypothetical protein MI824_17995 [Hyphomicrobiales bacterium]|nr:hypothetical protein [Hyphomicrobiales bacterium]
MKLPPYLTFACRGFALLVPVLALMIYLWWVGTARSGDPSVTNALIDTCVDIERGTGRNGLACVGRVLVPCKADPDNAHKADQMECDEREYVLWSRLMVQELKALGAKLSAEKKAKLRETQGLWDRFHTANCQLPAALCALPGRQGRCRRAGLLDRHARGPRHSAARLAGGFDGNAD